MVEYPLVYIFGANGQKLKSAKIRKQTYALPTIHNKYAVIVVLLSRFEHPDTSSFTDPEIVWKMHKELHIGVIVVSDSSERVLELLDTYTPRIASEFHASSSAPDKSL
jgi:hypothetical protein